MKIEKLAKKVDRDIVIQYYIRYDRWVAKIEGLEVLKDGYVVFLTGEGKTPIEALTNYIKQIKGKIGWINPRLATGKKYKISKNLEI